MPISERMLYVGFLPDDVKPAGSHMIWDCQPEGLPVCVFVEYTGRVYRRRDTTHDMAALVVEQRYGVRP